MYTTVEETADVTGLDVEQPHVMAAHYIMEMYTGRQESRVEDPDDLYILNIATSYQAAYIRQNTDTVFEQVPYDSIKMDTFTHVAPDSPGGIVIAPLAAMACERLSWFRSRSITTAPNFHYSEPYQEYGPTEDDYWWKC